MESGALVLGWIRALSFLETLPPRRGPPGIRPNRPALAGPILGPSPHPAACRQRGSGRASRQTRPQAALQHNGNCASCLSSMLRIPSRLPTRQMTVKPAQQRIMLPWRAFGTGFAGHAPAAGWKTNSDPCQSCRASHGLPAQSAPQVTTAPARRSSAGLSLRLCFAKSEPQRGRGAWIWCQALSSPLSAQGFLSLGRAQGQSHALAAPSESANLPLGGFGAVPGQCVGLSDS
jgi:hypothetical protein